MPTPAQRLALLLEVHDDSLRSAAQRCGLDHTTLMRVKGGETENPATLAKIAEGYGVPVMWMRGEPDLATDFMFRVLSRPLQERVMFLWERERRVAYAVKFLLQYAPAKYTVDHLAEVLAITSLEVQGMVVRGSGSVPGKQLQQLCAETGLPLDWFRSGLIGYVDEEQLLVGLATHALSSLAAKVGADLTEEQIAEMAAAMV